MTDDIFSKTHKILSSQKLNVVKKNISKPWGGFFIISEDKAMELHLTVLSLFKFDNFIPPRGIKFSCLDKLKRLNLTTPRNPFLYL